MKELLLSQVFRSLQKLGEETSLLSLLKELLWVEIWRSGSLSSYDYLSQSK